MTTKGFIFDYGGTLDTAGCHWGKMLWRAYQRCGVPVGEEPFREAYIHAERVLGRNPVIQPDYTFRQTLDVKIRLEMERLVATGAWQPTAEELQRRHDEVLDCLYRQVVATTAESRRVLARLGERYPLVLVSNFYGNMPTVLREFGLDGLFLSVIESAVVGVRKPDPRIFTLGVEALGLKAAEVVVVGDSFDKDILPARAAGCQTVWLRGEGWTEEDHDENVPNHTIHAINELLARYIEDTRGK